jgi:UPF0755 protein
VKRWVAFAALLLLLLAGGAVGGTAWWRAAVTAPGPMPMPRAVVVPRGSTEALAEALTADGIIDRPMLFRAAALVSRTQGALRAAEFAFPAHVSVADVLSILRTARPVEHKFTIAEGLTAQQIHAALAQDGALHGAVPAFAEGALLPETYTFERGTAPAAIVARAQAAMDKLLASAWSKRDANLPLGSAREALILASIVERETAQPAERAHIAAVYLNRLRRGMRLQADPTVVYGASNGAGTLDHGLTKAELARDDPYNTYRNAGLPPGPICSPGAATIEAVLSPAQSDDLYFVADGTGGHTFSRTLETHEAAVSRLRTLVPQTPHEAPRENTHARPD